VVFFSPSSTVHEKRFLVNFFFLPGVILSLLFFFSYLEVEKRGRDILFSPFCCAPPPPPPRRCAYAMKRYSPVLFPWSPPFFPLSPVSGSRETHCGSPNPSPFPLRIPPLFFPLPSLLPGRKAGLFPVFGESLSPLFRSPPPL